LLLLPSRYCKCNARYNSMYRKPYTHRKLCPKTNLTFPCAIPLLKMCKLVRNVLCPADLCSVSSMDAITLARPVYNQPAVQKELSQRV
jgi:hypothetical protein